MTVAPNFPFKKTALAVLVGSLLNANLGISASHAQVPGTARQQPKDLNLAGLRCGPLHAAYDADPVFHDYTYRDGVSEYGANIFDCYENLVQGVPAVLNVMDNDTYVDVFSPGNPTITLDGAIPNYLRLYPSNGSVTGIGSVGVQGFYTGFVYTPRVGFSGRDTFEYLTGYRNVSEWFRFVRVDVFVLPDAKSDSYTVNNAQSNVVFDVVANDLGVGTSPGNALTITNVYPGSVQGSVAISGNNTLLFTPQPTASGPQSFVYEVTDAIGQKANATVNVNVQQVPVAQNDGPFTLGCSGQTTANVLANDSFTGNAVVSVSTSPTSGTAQVLGNNQILYTPAVNFSGPDSFRYQLTDGVGNATADVRLSVLPNAANDAATMAYLGSASGNVLSNDCGTGLTVVGNSTPSKGSVTVQSNGSFSYTAAVGQFGADSFTYAARDSSGNNVSATVNLTIATPTITASNDSFSALCGGGNVTGNVLSNDNYVGAPTVTLASNVTKGTLSLNANGSFSYAPNAGVSGLDSFSYNLSTPAGNASATANLLILPSAGNLAIAVPYASATNGNAFSLACGTGLSVTSMSTPAKGTLNFTNDGRFTYQALAGRTGTDSFSVAARDSNNQNVSSTVNITIGSAPQFNFFYNGQLFDNSAALPPGSGAAQRMFVNQQFRDALIVKITDGNGLPLSGFDICFAAVPGANGASATLSPTHALTNAQGVAQVTATANGIAGSYQVNAALCAIRPPAVAAATSVAKADLQSPLVFALTNVALAEQGVPVPAAPWHSLAWLATLLGYLGYRRIRSK